MLELYPAYKQIKKHRAKVVECHPEFAVIGSSEVESLLHTLGPQVGIVGPAADPLNLVGPRIA